MVLFKTPKNRGEKGGTTVGAWENPGITGKNKGMGMSSFLKNSGAHTCTTRHLPGVSVLAMGAMLLGGCAEQGKFDLKSMFSPKEQAQEEVVARASTDTELIERDVEAPEVFEATEAGLWDGRPSLGGVWVAHPDVGEPERVLIRNTSNDKFVVGALFRRERDIPGPRLQVSSDAADVLSMLAGAPTQLEVVALRKEAVPVEDPLVDVAGAEALEEAAPIETASLDPLAGLEEAIEAAPLDTAALAGPAVETESKPAPTPVAAPAAASPAISKGFLQIGIYSSQENADRAANVMRDAGIIPTKKTFDRNGKTFWRVMVGPARSVAERDQLLAQIKKEGYTDAYPVTN